jgi:hypothetical protein
VADRLKVPLKELTKHFVANHVRPRGRFITDGPPKADIDERDRCVR